MNRFLLLDCKGLVLHALATASLLTGFGCSDSSAERELAKMQARLESRHLPSTVREIIASNDAPLPEWFEWPDAEKYYRAEGYKDGFGNRFGVFSVSCRDPFPGYVGEYGYHFVVDENLTVIGAFEGGTGVGGFGVIGGWPRDLNDDGWLECPAAFTRPPSRRHTEPEKTKEMIIWQFRPKRLVRLLNVTYIPQVETSSSLVIPRVDGRGIVIGADPRKPFVSFRWHGDSHAYVGASVGGHGAKWTVLPYQPVPRQSKP